MIYLTVVKNRMADVLHYTILLKHNLRKRYPSWDADHPSLLLVLVIIMYYSILKIVFLQIVRVLCSTSWKYIRDYFIIYKIKRRKKMALMKNTFFWKYQKSMKSPRDYLLVNMSV